MNLPSFQFYPGDWLRDNVSGCSLSAQGLWLRLMVVMHDSERYGYLCQNGNSTPPDVLARKCGTTREEFITSLEELFTAGVPSRTSDGIIYSRRMVRDAENRAKVADRVKKHRDKERNASVTPPSRECNGPSSSSSSSSNKKETKTSAPPQDGSAPPVVKSEAVAGKLMKRPTVEEVAAYLRERKSPVEAEAFVSFYESNGWRVGKNPMKNWHAAIVTWERRNQPDRRLGEVKQHWSEIPQANKMN